MENKTLDEIVAIVSALNVEHQKIILAYVKHFK